MTLWITVLLAMLPSPSLLESALSKAVSVSMNSDATSASTLMSSTKKPKHASLPTASPTVTTDTVPLAPKATLSQLTSSAKLKTNTARNTTTAAATASHA